MITENESLIKNVILLLHQKVTGYLYRPRRPEKTVLFDVIHKHIQDLVLGFIGFTFKFMSSLVPCLSAMVTRSGQKFKGTSLPNSQILNVFVYIKKHYKTWHKNSEQPIPGYIGKEFDKYLGCGILAKGFACAHCDSCNKEFFLAFSCKGRGISCNTKAMVETAANLIENVIPLVPVRQFVISFPKRIRHYLQTHSILQALLRIVIDEITKRLTIACEMPFKFMQKSFKNRNNAICG